jgi:quinol monooxygenase YgiN
MIIRVFRARVQSGMQDEYERLCREVAIPLMQAQPGLVALHVGKPTERAPDEFVMVSVWTDIQAIQAFVGEKWLEPKVLPEEAHLLQESFVQHYESLEDGQ